MIPARPMDEVVSTEVFTISDRSGRTGPPRVVNRVRLRLAWKLRAMSFPPPPFAQLGLPPLPPGWTEHLAPGGQSYFYNAQTKESTYIRPVPVFPIPQPTLQPTKKKEKPLIKTPIPGTEWLRVKTTEGKVFYTHKAKKQSVWIVPDEIKDAVASLEAEEKERQEQEVREAQQRLQDVTMTAEQAEVQRIKAEVEGMVKRKADEQVPLDEVVISKKARVEDDEKESDEESEEEEEWQREAAAQLAAEAEAEKKRVEEEAARLKKEAEAEAKKAKEQPQIAVPDRVDLSLDEAKALFKTLLREKDVNPLHPWDTSLPLFVSDPRYVLLPSVSARREAFDEYCRDRARELRQLNVKKEKEDPKAEYERLLSEEVKSTRQSWNEFRRAWKKDRRFYGWGRDDREREKRFREFVKELGEKKRAAAQKAEADFFALLREHGNINEDSAWKDVKRKLTHDPRYDAVGSSSLREELFNTFLKAGPTLAAPNTAEPGLDSPAVTEEVDEAEKEKKRKERAVKEREEQVREKRSKVEAEIGRSKMGLSREEGERDFMSMLVDAIREPTAQWEASLPQLKTDPRFLNSPLSVNQQLHVFRQHIDRLSSKYTTSLHAMFEADAPSLATPFTALQLPALMSSLPVTKLGMDVDQLEAEFDRWQRRRTQEARKAFDEMLSENSFVEFWGRLGKIGGEGVEGGVKADELGEDEGEGGGGKVDMKVLAKSVDVEDMEKVLRNDKRYVMFDHAPDLRERWIRDYLSNLAAPKLSVHVAEHAH
ncbi:hypothetical protein HGRIS_009982 [Hohenbuehelia grisea]|uniref:Transcription elongation regulator 1 n=1 Tax=Hohenbuehelia grisea TaxID=104357 RepID=A0ABR3J335_9AGAR